MVDPPPPRRRLRDVPPDVRTVLLDAFTPPHAERVVAALEDAAIVWWAKVPGFLTSMWDRDVHVFVDRARLDEARSIARGAIEGGPRSG